MMTLGEYLKQIFTMTELHTSLVYLDGDDEGRTAHSFVYGDDSGPNEAGGEKIVTFGRPFPSQTSYGFVGPSINIRIECKENDYLVEYPLEFI